MSDTTHSLDDKGTTQVGTPLVTPRNIAFAIVPIGVGLGAIHEVGLFWALGLTAPWKFAVVFPIPIQDMLKVTLLFGLDHTIFALFLLSLIVSSWVILKLMIGLSNSLPAVPLFQFRSTKLTKLEDQISSRFQKFHSLLNRIINKLNSNIFLALLFFVLWALVILMIGPALNLLKEFCGTVLFACIITELLGRVISGLLAGKFMLWIFDVEFHSNFRPPIPSQYVRPLFGIFFLIVQAFDSGHYEGVTLLSPRRDGKPYSYVAVPFNGRCAQIDRPTFVRAYTTGVIYFNDNQLFWHPADEKSPCWSFPVERTKYSWQTITPMVAGVRLESLSFDTLTDK